MKLAPVGRSQLCLTLRLIGISATSRPRDLSVRSLSRSLIALADQP
jgi:hypothetical protein